ncbi:MAG: hypothetical protein PHW02_01350 [bacterium]|nr:hypothetical protein [bacterium]
MILSVLVYLIVFAYSFMSAVFVFKSIEFSWLFTMNHFWFYLGGTFYLMMKLFIRPLRENTLFFETFQHEATHMLFALLSFKKVYKFQATTSDGGEVKTEDVTPLIALSPYSIPILAIGVSLLSYVVKEKYIPFVIAFSGILFMQFLISALKDIFTMKQPDLSRYSPLVSYPIVIISLLFSVLFSYLLLSYGIKAVVSIPKSFIFAVF